MNQTKTQGCFNDVENVLIPRIGGGFVSVYFVTMLQILCMYYSVFIKFYIMNNEKPVQKEWYAILDHFSRILCFCRRGPSLPV